MHFVVTGANGFIGRHFVRHAKAAGQKITIVDIAAPQVVPDGVDTILTGGIDELCDRTDLLESADAVCHLAAATIPASSQADPLRDVDLNIRPLVQLLETMKDHGNKRILFLSSGGAVYGVPQSVPISEDHATNPISPYGVGKLAIEKFLHCYSVNHGFSTVSIRPANPYGPEQGKIGQLGAVWTFIQMIRQEKTATLFGDGGIVRDFVHVDDLSQLMIASLKQGAEGVFNCGGGSGTTLKDLIATIEDMTGKTLSIDRHPPRAFDPPAIVLDISRAKQELGWSPQVSLREGIERLLA